MHSAIVLIQIWLEPKRCYTRLLSLWLELRTTDTQTDFLERHIKKKVLPTILMLKFLNHS